MNRFTYCLWIQETTEKVTFMVSYVTMIKHYTAKYCWVSHTNIKQSPVAHLSTHLHLPSTMCMSSSIECNHTSGSMCLGNSEVVRYLYKILMSSCSNPLLKHRENTGLQSGIGLLTSLLYSKACFCLSIIGRCWARDVVKTGEELPSMHEALRSIPSTAWACWCTSVIPALKKLRQKDQRSTFAT